MGASEMTRKPIPNWLKVMTVGLIVAAIILLKPKSQDVGHADNAGRHAGRVIVVATDEESRSSTRCGDIVRLARSVANRGFDVEEVRPESGSKILSQYAIFTTPTVLIFNTDGTLRSRYEGEAVETLASIQNDLKIHQP